MFFSTDSGRDPYSLESILTVHPTGPTPFYLPNKHGVKKAVVSVRCEEQADCAFADEPPNPSEIRQA